MESALYSLSDYCSQSEFKVPNQEDHEWILQMNETVSYWDDPLVNTDRIKEALYIHSDIKPINALDRPTLAALAKRVNAAFIHYSGNCAILANAMAYNLIAGREVFCVKNTFPLHLGLNHRVTAGFFHKWSDRVVHKQYYGLMNFQEINKLLIYDHSYTHNQIYMIYIHYPILFGLTSEGHSFNAVILKDKENNPEVVYVDPWFPSKPLFTSAELDKEYNLNSFTITAANPLAD